MEINTTTIEGTYLALHNELVAGRNTPTDRNTMGWYECLRCGEFLAIRNANVISGQTVSCGCHGRKLFIGHQEQRAENLPKSTRQQMFMDRYKLNPKRRLGVGAIERKYNVDGFLVSFAILAHKKLITALAGLYRGAANLLDRAERKWIHHVALIARMRASNARNDAFLAGLTWRELAMVLAHESAERIANSLLVPVAMRCAMIQDEHTVITFA